MLFLIKYSRPNISNVVRKLSKLNNKANYAHYKQMLQAINYILKSRNRLLRFMSTSEKDEWEFKCMCDSDYAEDKDNHFSVMDYCIYINACLIS